MYTRDTAKAIKVHALLLLATMLFSSFCILQRVADRRLLMQLGEEKKYYSMTRHFVYTHTHTDTHVPYIFVVTAHKYLCIRPENCNNLNQ